MASSRHKTSCCSTMFGYVPRAFPESWSRRFKHASYLPGNIIFGKGLEISSADGRGFGNLIRQLGDAALVNASSKTSYCYITPCRIAALSTDPAIIKNFIYDHHDNLHLHDITGSFEMFFGKKTYFAKPFGSKEQKAGRARFVNTFVRASELKKDAPDMQRIMGEHLAEVSKHSVVDTDTFASHATMEMLGHTKLGFKGKLEKTTADKVSSIVRDCATEVATGKIQLTNKILPERIAQSMFPRTRLGKLLKHGEKIIRDEILEPNREAIQTTDNWLHGESKEPVDLASDDVTNAVKEIFIAGHDTSKILLSSCLKLLADSKNHAVVTKLREEIFALRERLGSEPSTWTRDEVLQLTYLHQVVQESLRLYPPIPDIIFMVKDKMEYLDGVLYPDDLVIVSARVVHRDPRIWGEDAHEFKPERFADFKDDDSTAYQFFPFGFKPKICPGQHFSKQEVKIALVRLLYEFNMEFVNKDYHHPFPYSQMFTLRFDDSNVQMRFTKREVKESKLEHESVTEKCIAKM